LKGDQTASSCGQCSIWLLGWARVGYPLELLAVASNPSRATNEFLPCALGKLQKRLLRLRDTYPPTEGSGPFRAIATIVPAGRGSKCTSPNRRASSAARNCSTDQLVHPFPLVLLLLFRPKIPPSSKGAMSRWNHVLPSLRFPYRRGHTRGRPVTNSPETLGVLALTPGPERRGLPRALADQYGCRNRATSLRAGLAWLGW
jgi:hypothetical protein